MQNHKKNYNSTIYASYLGYITQAIINNFLPLLFVILNRSLGLSLIQITSITTLNFAVQLIVDLLAAWFIKYIGYKVAIVSAHIFAVIGLVGIAVLPIVTGNAYLGIIISVVIYAVGGGLTEVLISPIVEACPSENKEKAMSMLHSFYCWGTVLVILVSTVFLQIFGRESYKVLAVLWAVLPLVNTFWFMNVPIIELPEEKKSPLKSLLKNKAFYVLLILMVAAGAAEQSVSQWASLFSEKTLSIPKIYGDLAGPCFFSIMMGISRAYYGKRGEKIELRKFIVISSLLCFAAYMVLAFVGIPAVVFVGCGLCGLSVGIMWPGVFSIAAQKIPLGGTTMFALLALAGDIGCSSGPTLVGVAAEKFGGDIKMGFAVASIFSVIMLLGVRRLAKR